MNKRAKLFGAVFLAVASLLAVTPVHGHKFHTSLTRLEHDSKKGLIEITMRVFLHDLVPVLERLNGRRLDMDKPAVVDPLIVSYVSRNFEISDKKGTVQKLVWVGKDVDVDNAFLFFEIASQEGPVGFSVKNSLFFESFPEQTNLLVSRFEKKKCDLVFVVGDKMKELSFK